MGIIGLCCKLILLAVPLALREVWELVMSRLSGDEISVGRWKMAFGSRMAQGRGLERTHMNGSWRLAVWLTQ